MTIKINAQITWSDNSVDEKALRKLNFQIAEDFLYGTFSPLPRTIFNKIEGGGEALKSIDEYRESSIEIGPQPTRDDLINKRYDITIEVNESVFEELEYGLQHLAGILLGDTFSRISSMINHEVKIKSIDLGSTREKFINHYRGYSHSISNLRAIFGLSNQEPLSAFSLKPRSGWDGVDLNVIKDICISCFEAGVKIVEFDTRYLSKLSRIDPLIKMVGDLDGKGYLSLNLSYPTSVTLDIVKKLSELENEKIVIKIDGGLDGLSTIQKVRNLYRDKFVITCYPLLRNRAISDMIGANSLVDWLSISGVDIIYPGGAPTLRSEGEILRQTLSSARESYFRYSEQGWPLPSVAGGLHAGELHAFMEILGPDIAFFLGGAIALHKDGIIEGARLCSAALKLAVESTFTSDLDWSECARKNPNYHEFYSGKYPPADKPAYFNLGDEETFGIGFTRFIDTENGKQFVK